MSYIVYISNNHQAEWTEGNVKEDSFKIID